jgi:hypothetical protein
MIRGGVRRTATLVLLVTVVGLAAAACANRVQPLPTPTIEALAPMPTVRPTATTFGGTSANATVTPEARATPQSASDASAATLATAVPAAVGGGSNDTFHFRGPEDAAVTVAEFADFQ